MVPQFHHRHGAVVVVRDEGQAARVSFPMAVYLWEEETLEVLPGLHDPRYEPIQAVRFHTRITSKFYGEGYAVEE